MEVNKPEVGLEGSVDFVRNRLGFLFVFVFPRRAFFLFSGKAHQ